MVGSRYFEKGGGGETLKEQHEQQDLESQLQQGQHQQYHEVILVFHYFS